MQEEDAAPAALCRLDSARLSEWDAEFLEVGRRLEWSDLPARVEDDWERTPLRLSQLRFFAKILYERTVFGKEEAGLEKVLLEKVRQFCDERVRGRSLAEIEATRESGDLTAAGDAYYFGFLGAEVDPKRAHAFYREAMDRGDPESFAGNSSIIHHHVRHDATERPVEEALKVALDQSRYCVSKEYVTPIGVQSLVAAVRAGIEVDYLRDAELIASAARRLEPPRSERVCAACGVRDRRTLRKCERCRAARYCSVACQRKDWPRHKTQCKRADKDVLLVAASRLRLAAGDPFSTFIETYFDTAFRVGAVCVRCSEDGHYARVYLEARAGPRHFRVYDVKKHAHSPRVHVRHLVLLDHQTRRAKTDYAFCIEDKVLLNSGYGPDRPAVVVDYDYLERGMQAPAKYQAVVLGDDGVCLGLVYATEDLQFDRRTD